VRGTLRTAGRIASALVLAVALTGCIKLHMDLGLQDDDTVDGTITLAVDKQLLELSGTSKEDFLAQMTAGDSPVPEGVKVKTSDYEDDTFVGQTYEFTGAPLTALGGSGGEDLSIVREGDEYHVTGTLDLSAADSGVDLNDPTVQPFLESFDVQISITFPGAVTSATGTIDGNTVTWTPKIGDTVQIQAVGSAIDNGQGGSSGGSSSLLWILIGAAALLAIVLGLVLFLSRRGKGEGAATEGGTPGMVMPGAEAPVAAGAMGVPSAPVSPEAPPAAPSPAGAPTPPPMPDAAPEPPTAPPEPPAIEPPGTPAAPSDAAPEPSSGDDPTG
jgi:hypothetical protein